MTRVSAMSRGLCAACVVLLLSVVPARFAAAQTVAGSVPLGSQPVGQIAVNALTDRVYVAGGYAENQLTIVDVATAASPTVVTTLSDSAGGSGVTVNPNTNVFYTSNGFGGQVLAYSGATNTVITSTSIGPCPGAFDVDATTNLVYVTRQCGGTAPRSSSTRCTS